MKKLVRTFVTFFMIACLTLSMSGCMSNDWAKVRDKLVNKGYSINTETTDAGEIGEFLSDFYVNDYAIIVDPVDISCVLTATNSAKMIVIVFCKDNNSAKRVSQSFKSDKIKLCSELGVYSKDYKTGKSGKVVYFGHKDAVRTAKWGF